MTVVSWLNNVKFQGDGGYMTVVSWLNYDHHVNSKCKDFHVYNLTKKWNDNLKFRFTVDPLSYLLSIRYNNFKTTLWNETCVTLT